MIELRSLLQRLILEGESILARKRVDVDQLVGLLEAVDHYRKVAAVDGPRIIDHHTALYAQALHCAARALQVFQPERAIKFARVVGVLIDDIRADFAEAIEQGKRPSA